MKFDKDSLLLYAVTDRHWLKGRSLKEDVESALKGGASFIQLREKEDTCSKNFSNPLSSIARRCGTKEDVGFEPTCRLPT